MPLMKPLLNPSSSTSLCGWVGGWVGIGYGKIEEEEAVRMRYCELGGGWVRRG